MAQIKKNDPKMKARTWHKGHVNTAEEWKTIYLGQAVTSLTAASPQEFKNYTSHPTSGGSYVKKGMWFNKGGQTKKVSEMSTNREAARKAERRAKQGWARQEVAKQMAGVTFDRTTGKGGGIITASEDVANELIASIAVLPAGVKKK